MPQEGSALPRSLGTGVGEWTRWAAQPDVPLEARRGALLFLMKSQGQEVAGQPLAHCRGSPSVCELNWGLL